MNHLVPCPGCARHVRHHESSCPFCGEQLALAHLPPPVLPRKRLGRAATFAFGAGVVGAATLVSCSEDEGTIVPIYGSPTGSFGGSPVAGAPSSAGAGNDSGGSAAAGSPGDAGAGGDRPTGIGGEGIGGEGIGGEANAGAGGDASAGAGGQADAGAGGVGELVAVYGGPPQD